MRIRRGICATSATSFPSACLLRNRRRDMICAPANKCCLLVPIWIMARVPAGSPARSCSSVGQGSAKSTAAAAAADERASEQANKQTATTRRPPAVREQYARLLLARPPVCLLALWAPALRNCMLSARNRSLRPDGNKCDRRAAREARRGQCAPICSSSSRSSSSNVSPNGPCAPGAKLALVSPPLRNRAAWAVTMRLVVAFALAKSRPAGRPAVLFGLSEREIYWRPWPACVWRAPKFARPHSSVARKSFVALARSLAPEPRRQPGLPASNKCRCRRSSESKLFAFASCLSLSLTLACGAQTRRGQTDLREKRVSLGINNNQRATAAGG